MKNVLKRLLKTLIVTALLMYVGVILFKQEVTFNKYDDEIEMYARSIEEEELKKEQLINTKSKISSKEYIEEIARDKLGLVMPNEIVFVDANL